MIPFKLIHLSALLVWFGSMFFACIMLRPAVVGALRQPERMRLWDTVLRCFFNWVWIAIGAVLVTGFYLVYQNGGIARAAPDVRFILALELLMIAIFGYVFFGGYVPFSLHVAKQRWEEAEKRLGIIRKLVALSLLLGLLTVIMSEGGYGAALMTDYGPA